MVKGKNIVIGITGGIAAYKTASLVSKLTKEGASVHVCMTKNARAFIAPLTLETLSKNRVVTDGFNREAPYDVDHVSWAKMADLIIVAPATANVLAKAAAGIADDFLTTLLLAARCEVAFAPAMNTAMLNHVATQQNIKLLQERGCYMIAPGSGMLACGDLGDGRMAEPEDIFAFIDAYFTEKKDFSGKHVLVTAGPTREKIDDVRYITNRSSGKMGHEIALVAARRGADVTLVTGAADFTTPMENVHVVHINSAQEMFDACMAVYAGVDAVIKAAAVADYTPEHYLPGKMKKADDFALPLKRTQDILKTMGEQKTNQILVGFAAEAVDLDVNAKGKLERKNLDVIAANDITDESIAFNSDENALVLYFKDGSSHKLAKASKTVIAGELLDIVSALLSAK